jgi:hypothetical protein
MQRTSRNLLFPNTIALDSTVAKQQKQALKAIVEVELVL